MPININVYRWYIAAILTIYLILFIAVRLPNNRANVVYVNLPAIKSRTNRCRHIHVEVAVCESSEYCPVYTSTIAIRTSLMVLLSRRFYRPLHIGKPRGHRPVCQSSVCHASVL